VDRIIVPMAAAASRAGEQASYKAVHKGLGEPISADADRFAAVQRLLEGRHRVARCM
jgi:hypothetical protein